MLYCGRFLALTSFVALMLGMGLRAQDGNARRPEARNTSRTAQTAEPSDLAQENMGRVAAAAPQIQAVLLQDAGLLVELKRWVAKEATDNGQVVEDSLLTDQAIFDRLDHDVEFRSVATLLVQRYGYLLPSVNPESEVAKQQDLVLKERAHIMAQREDQQQAAALAAVENERKEMRDEARNAERSGCDPRVQSICDEPASMPRQPRGTSPGDMTVPDFSTPLFPGQVSPNDSLRMQRRASSDQSGLGGQDSGLMLAADSRRSAEGADSGSGLDPGMGMSSGLAMGMGATMGAGSMPSGGMDALDSLLRRGNLDDLSALSSGNRADATTAPIKDMNRTMRLHGARGPWGGADKDLPPITMVHKASPYADIPSLYDMNVQAASRDQDPERFGMEIFRNGTRQMDAIPMDLPVGPDYVIGPGDGLAINLWGGISQRMIRSVDREGRITLPEAGPVLVSGRTLGEVQESVQKVLRTQYRDVSADVSCPACALSGCMWLEKSPSPALTTSVRFLRRLMPCLLPVELPHGARCAT